MKLNALLLIIFTTIVILYPTTNQSSLLVVRTKDNLELIRSCQQQRIATEKTAEKKSIATTATEQNKTPPYIKLLWFILSVATLYVSAQGVRVVDSGRRRWVDTHWFRGNSYFRIGWDWVQASLLNGWKLITSVTFSSHQDPTPAIASLKQHEQRLYQLQFQVQTYSYNVC